MEQIKKNNVAIIGIVILIAIIIVIILILIKKYNEKLTNEIFEEKFSNKDYINEEDSYENKYLLEQKVFNMLKPINQKKYLNLTETAKDAFLTNISVTKI